MKFTILTLLIIIAVATGGPFTPDADARNAYCTIKATKDVYLQAHYSDGGRKSPQIRRKSNVIWSGTLQRGGTISVNPKNGWVHLEYRDLTQDDPRSENNDAICQNGRVILVPR
jgi:hypothetical protein